MRPLRVAFIVSQFPMLSETFILSQITGLMDRGHRVDVFTTQRGRDAQVHPDVLRYRLLERTRHIEIPKSRGRRLMRALGILARHLWIRPTRVAGWLRRIRAEKVYQAFNVLFQVEPFWQGDYDIVHCHFGPNGEAFLFLKAWTRAKYVCSFYGYDVSEYLKERGDDVYRELFTQGDLFVAMSDHMRGRLEALGCERRRLAVRRLGIDVSRFTPADHPSHADQPVRILAVARLVEKKGHEFAIRAVAQAVKAHPALLYQIAGEGPLESFLRSLTRELSLERHVSFLGAQSHDAVARLMAEADIFLLPSITAASGDQEGIPVSLAEAQASGLPVVATRHSGTPELVEDGRSGFLVPERDVEALADRLRFLIEHSEIRRQFGERGRRIVEARYNAATLNDRLEQLYRAVLDGATPASLDQGDEHQDMAAAPVGGVAQGDDQSLPLVSVIVPVFNGERTIGACLESLLAQEYPRDRCEIIAVDNGSRDRTADIIRRYPVTYVLEDRVQSSYAARNAGIRAATGDILAFTDADCVASPQWVRCAAAAFSDPSVGSVAGELRSTPPRTLAQRYCAAQQAVSQRGSLEHAFRPYAQTGNVLYRRGVLNQIGLFDVSLISGGDADLSWRMLELPGTRLQFVPEALVYYVHRETLKGLLKQHAAYGYGSVLLYRKHRDQVGRRTLKHTYWEARSFGRKVGRLAKGCAQRAVSWDGHEANGAPLSHDALRLLVFLARKAGQVKGSIKHRVWYV